MSQSLITYPIQQTVSKKHQLNLEIIHIAKQIKDPLGVYFPNPNQFHFHLHRNQHQFQQLQIHL